MWPQVQHGRLTATQGHVRALAHPLQCCTLCASPALPQILPCLDPFFLTPRLYCLLALLFP